LTRSVGTTAITAVVHVDVDRAAGTRLIADAAADVDVRDHETPTTTDERQSFYIYSRMCN